jgi:hypothetical protein
MDEEGTVRGSSKTKSSEVRNISAADQGASRAAAENSGNGHTFSWNSVMQFLANVEPLPAAAIAGAIGIFVLILFGRIGALVIGIIAGSLLHTSIDQRRLVHYETWKKRFTSGDPVESISSEHRKVYAHQYSH